MERKDWGGVIGAQGDEGGAGSDAGISPVRRRSQNHMRSQCAA